MPERCLDTLTEVLTKTEISWNFAPFIAMFHNMKHQHFKIRNLILKLKSPAGNYARQKTK
jgi:hypothetical protein